MIGSVIGGKYRIEKQLGEGGMGAVYKAVHTGTGRQVALKVIHSAEVAGADAIARFEQEARTTGNIDTQHIVQVLDTGADPSPYMVMELMVGEDLSQLVSRVGPIDPDLVLRMGAQACLGLQKAHEAGVVHRDIKPANLFLAKKDLGEAIVKVLDFGIAKVRKDPMGASNAGLTRTGSMLGSPLYMSPEQARGSKNVDHRTDIWSLGLVMYEALCGAAPWADLETLGELILSICSQQTPNIQEKAPWVPPHVAKIVHGALTLQPDRRYASALDMFNVIRAALPNGWGIHETMLVGLNPQQRAFTASRFDISVNEPVGTQSSPNLVSSNLAHPLAQSSPTITGSNVATTQNGPPAKGSGGVIAAVGVAAVVLVGAVASGGYFALKGRGAPVTAAPPSASASTVEPVPSASASALPKESSEPAAKVVRVKVEPPNAEVTVDGVKVEPEAGSVEVKGALGSVHTVTVTEGQRDTSAKIVVTETGALPAQVVLAKAASHGGKADPKLPASGGGAKPAASAAGTATLPGTGIKKGTEEFQ